MNLSSTIKSIQDIVRKDDGIDGDTLRQPKSELAAALTHHFSPEAEA